MTCNAPNRIYNQYRGKTKAVAWYEITRTIGDELCSAFTDIRESYDINNANKAELDVIGRIVDIARTHETIEVLSQFECGDTGVECGEPDVECASGFIASGSELSDAFYRKLIFSKIAKNNSDATLDGIVRLLNIIVPDAMPHVIDNEDMSFTVEFGRLLNEIEIILLTKFDILPRPQGVIFDGYIEIPSLPVCGESWVQCGESQAQCTFTF